MPNLRTLITESISHIMLKTSFSHDNFLCGLCESQCPTIVMGTLYSQKAQSFG